MKTIRLDFQNLKKSHVIYALYILTNLRNKYTQSQIVCLIDKENQILSELTDIDSFFYDKKSFKEYTSKLNIEAFVTWDGISKVIINKTHKSLPLEITSSKLNPDINQLENSGKWLAYKEAETILKLLLIRNRSFHDFLVKIPKSDLVDTLTKRTINKSTTILYLSLPQEYLSNEQKTIINHWIIKILESHSVSIVLKAPHLVDIKHPNLVILSKEDVTLYDDIHLINDADYYAGVSGNNEQIAAFFKKPLFIFVSSYQWSQIDHGCWVNYLKFSNIRSVENYSNKMCVCVAEQAYQDFSELIYAVNLNIKLSLFDLKNIHFIIENPMAFMFFNKDEKNEWQDQNQELSQWVVPVIHERGVFQWIKTLVKITKSYHITIICTHLKWHQELIFNVIAIPQKLGRSIQMINNRFFKQVPLPHLVEGIYKTNQQSI